MEILPYPHQLLLQLSQGGENHPNSEEVNSFKSNGLVSVSELQLSMGQLKTPTSRV